MLRQLITSASGSNSLEICKDDQKGVPRPSELPFLGLCQIPFQLTQKCPLRVAAYGIVVDTACMLARAVQTS